MHTQITTNRSLSSTLPWKIWETHGNVADRIAQVSQSVFETLSWAATSLCSLTTPAINVSISIGKPSLSMACRIISLLALGSASGTSTLSSTPIAPTNTSDQLINTYTNEDQRDPSTTAFFDDSFVVTWWSVGVGYSFFAIFGQRFFANGSASGTEFTTSYYTNRYQRFPSTATFSDDSFVVTWEDQVGGNGSKIFGQRFFANGSARGEEFRANNYTNGFQWYPSTAAFSDGSFVVTWYGEGVDDNLGIFGQRFFANSSAWGEEFRANTYTNGNQIDPSTATFSDDSFVVTWWGEGVGDNQGIFGQRFFANGSARGEEFCANTFTNGGQGFPSTAAFSDGSFVVTWHGGGEGDNSGIFGQLFFANGSAWKSEFRVNTYTNGGQGFPSTAAFSDGSFVVTWEGEGAGDSSGIFGQLFFANSSARGSEFQINAYTNGEQKHPSTASFSDGSFVVTWHGEETSGSSIYNVYGKRFNTFGQPIPWQETSLSSSAFPRQTTANALTTTSTQLNSPSPSSLSTRQFPYSTLPSVDMSSSASISSQSRETTTTNEANILLITTCTYEVSYPIIVDGETIGTFTFTGGTGQLDSNNDNTLNIQLDPDLTLENGVAIILFTIPAGEELLWEDIVLAYDTESQCYHAEGVFTTSEEDHVYQLVFEYDSTDCSLYTEALKLSTIPALVNGLS